MKLSKLLCLVFMNLVLGLYAVDLNTALDDESLTITTGGDAGWFGQTEETYDGLDAAQSGDLDYGEQSWMSTTVTGPVEIAFYWRMITDGGEMNDNSVLSFFVDGELVNYLDYYSDEFEEFTCVYRGTNEVALTWLYQHNAMFTGGGEQGWVDELVLTPALDLPPYIYEQPEMTAVLSNSTAILSVASYGADLSYQWYEGESGDTNAPVSGATGPSLTTLPVTKDSVFWVRITNSFGTDDSDSANVVVYHEVYTVADLQKVGSGVNGWDEEDAYILMNSIDCSALSPESPYVISSISGLFNGNECILSNLFVFADGNSGGGLFSVNYGEIRNLGLSRFCVTNAGSHTGGVCAENYGSIRECFVDGDIYATGGEGGDYIGLICGQSYGPNHEPGPGVVEDCYSCGSIEFEGCYYVGGLVGHNGGIVNRCYSIAKINDLGWSDDFGAFIGREGGNSEVTDCYCSYWGGYSGSAIGLFQDELTNAVNFAGFDFVGSSLDGDSDFWSIETGHCPKLSWQSGPGPVTDASGPDTTLSGEGSPNNPFVISSLADFYEFSDNEELSIGYYRLDVDIDLSGTNFTCAVVNREFSGVFDGNGHVVANMFIDVDCSDSVGLFMLNSGTLYELGVESYCISNALESVGGLCGINSGLISGCFASGDIYGAAEEECYNIGGLCGKNRGSSGGGFIEFDNVAFSEEVDGASAFPEFGGLVVIEDSYSGGAVYLDGAEAVGGLVGYNDAEIYRSYSITEVDVSENSQGVGAFVGEEEFSSYVEDCYVYSWAGSPGSAIALTSPEMEDAYSYGGFDFVGSSLDGSNDVWDIVFGFCPKLEWQSGNGLPVPDYVPETTLSGDGTSTSPFVIASLSDFYEFAENSELSAGYYQLDVDVDLSGTNYSTAVIDREFNGVFDGNTHTISDLLIDADGGSNVGLFKINGGTILDLGLEGFCISNVYRYAGAICGENYGRISRCFVNGDLYGDSFSSCYSVGALCGENYGSSAGYSPGIIEDCFAAGSVYIYDGNAGGFAGSLDGICRRCYTITKVKDLSGPAKAFSGSEFEDSCVVENCYAYFWSGDPASATALFSNELTQASSFDGFDFSDSSLDGTNDLWSISAGHCPKLVWQSGDGFAPPSFGANTTLSGDGSPLSPFVIGTLSDFYEFIGNSELSRGSYRLDLDLDLSGTNFTATVVDREFWGVFDGNGHVVSNLTINSTGDYLGFFSWNHGVVRDLGIENITIGGGVDNDTLGGICAINSEGVISNCYVNASLAGDDYIGAICGRNFGGIIAQCYAFGNIAGTDYVGGICGLNNFGGEISQCYSMATVSGESYYGGVCGSGSGVATNTYFYFMTSADNGIGTALYRDELLMSSSFSGFDFAGTSADGTADIWDITAGHPPKLNWQSGAVPAAPELPALAGNGSASDPFVISNLSDFHAFSTNALYSQGHYLLAVSLDLSGDSYNASVVNRSFGGCFDGGGHSISNLVINTGGSSTDYLGLFSYLTGTVKNLGVEAVSITGNSYSDFCGGVCGYSFGGVVSNCYVTGSVSANNYLGGLCGQCEDGTVYKSYADVDVAGDDYLGGLVGQTYDSSAYECYAAGDVNGEDYCGGFSGYHVSGTINNCYASGDVSGLEHVAGFCPNNYGGTISRCFAGGVVTGESELGGFCEYSSEFLIQDCYFYILGGPDVGFGSPLSSAQLQLAASFAGFDFAGDPSDGIEDIWAITAGYMPRLSWQPDEGVSASPGCINERIRITFRPLPDRKHG